MLTIVCAYINIYIILYLNRLKAMMDQKETELNESNASIFQQVDDSKVRNRRSQLELVWITLSVFPLLILELLYGPSL